MSASVPDLYLQLTALNTAIAVETDPTRRDKMFLLQRKILKLVLPDMKENLDDIEDTP